MFRQAGLQAADFRNGNIGAGGIARIGDENHLGLRRHGCEDRIHIHRTILFLHRHRGRARTHDLDLVNEETVFGDDRLIARAQINVAKQAEKLVRTVAAHDIRDVETVHVGNRLAQRDRLTVRIDFQMAGSRAESLYRLRARPKRRFVGGELINLRDAVHMFLARNISGDIQNTRTRNRLAKLCTHLIDLWKSAGEPGKSNAGGIRPEWALCRGSARFSLACGSAGGGHPLRGQHRHKNATRGALGDGQSLIETLLGFHHDDTGKKRPQSAAGMFEIAAEFQYRPAGGGREEQRLGGGARREIGFAQKRRQLSARIGPSGTEGRVLHARPDAAPVRHHDHQTAAGRQHPPQFLQAFTRIFGKFQRVHHQDPVYRRIRQRQFLIENQRRGRQFARRPVHRPLPRRHEGEGALRIATKPLQKRHRIAEPDQPLFRQRRP